MDEIIANRAPRVKEWLVNLTNRETANSLPIRAFLISFGLASAAPSERYSALALTGLSNDASIGLHL